MSGPLPTFHAPRRASAGHPTVARGAAARPLRRTGRVASACADRAPGSSQSSIRLKRRAGLVIFRSVRVRSSPPRTGRYVRPTGDGAVAEPVRPSNKDANA